MQGSSPQPAFPPSHSPIIGYILKGYPRISESFISNEILFLERLGLSLRLFSMRRPRENFTHASVRQIRARVDYLPSELLENFPALVIPAIFQAVRHPDRFCKVLHTAADGYNKQTALATLKHILQAAFLCEHFLRREIIAHLHGHFAHSPTSVTLFTSQLSGIPFSFTAHAKDIYTSRPEKLRRKIEAAQFVVTCTRYNAQHLRQVASSCTTPIHCIYHGIDLGLFSPLPDIRQPRPPYQLLTVARITPKKGLATIYRALARLRDQGWLFEHVLIGDGEDREKIMTLIGELGLTNCCRLLGTKTHEEVLRFFRTSDLFVLGCEIAANGDRDGIPNVLVESLAMGIPAISTSVSAIPEVLVNDQTGITVPPKDPQKLAEAIASLLHDHSARCRLIAAGKRHVEENFDTRKWIDKLATLFLHHTNVTGSPTPQPDPRDTAQ